MSRARRELLLSAAFAVWGLAIAIALITVFERPAPPDQTGGAARLLNFDAHGPLRWIGALMLVPILLPLALRPIGRILAGGAAWAISAVLIAPLVTLWIVTIHISLWSAIVPGLVVVVLCTLFRRRELDFTRYDVVLVPAFLTALLALIDLTRLSSYDCLVIAVILILVVRLAVTFIPSPLPPALAFLIAPLGLVLQTGFFARDQRYFGWHALALVLITPFVLRAVLRNRPRAVFLLAMVIYPLALIAYWNAMSELTAEGKPRMNFFEDGHALLPASEYLRGELPYRDILPAHGLIEDGGFDHLVFQTGEVNAGRRGKTRQIVGMLMAAALYALAFGITGSPHAAVLGVLLCIMMGSFAPTVRMLPAIVTLAIIVAAVRWRRPRWFACAAFGTVVCGMTSLDFGAYGVLTLLVALVRTPRPLRRDVLRWSAVGLGLGVVPLFAWMAILGIADDFVYGTFFEVPSAGPAYTLGFLSAPIPMQERRFFPEVLSVALDPQIFHYLFWAAVTVFVGVTVTRRWSRRFEPMVLSGVWAVLTGISYAERHHLYFGMAAGVMLVAVICMLIRRRSALAIPTIVAAIVLANPTTHLSVVGYNRKLRGPPPEWTVIPDLPRARGAYWHKGDVAAIASVRKYISTSLKPDETFLDFANSGLYYYLFNRDCPIRQYEVAFYQSEADQREVIRRIASNPKIRAVLVARTSHGRFTVDVPNGWRTPLVHQYILEHFEPDYEEGEVAFWRRR